MFSSKSADAFPMIFMMNSHGNVIGLEKSSFFLFHSLLLSCCYILVERHLNVFVISQGAHRVCWLSMKPMGNIFLLSW